MHNTITVWHKIYALHLTRLTYVCALPCKGVKTVTGSSADAYKPV